MILLPPPSTLFPYTTLFRSHRASPAAIGTSHRSGARDRSTETGASQLSACQQARSEEHTSELQSPCNLVCRLLLEKKKENKKKKLKPRKSMTKKKRTHEV